jgi:hypothetical protein
MASSTAERDVKSDSFEDTYTSYAAPDAANSVGFTEVP